MSVPPDPPVVSDAAYRQSRVMDGARMLPVLGVLLFLLPLLWAVAPPGASTARTGIFLFAAWALLILVARLLAYRLAPRDGGATGGSDRP